MSMFDGLLDNIDDVAAKLGLPVDQVQAVVANLKDKVSAGGNPVDALSAVAQEHGLSLDSLKSMLPDGGEGLLAKAQSMLDRDGDGNPLNDLGSMAKGLFGNN
ncbi:MAG: hypothetical protein J7494_05915 [Sphingobium sp.]|nr:hypothetical protein [Sphingobium sp.]